MQTWTPCQCQSLINEVANDGTGKPRVRWILLNLAYYLGILHASACDDFFDSLIK